MLKRVSFLLSSAILASCVSQPQNEQLANANSYNSPELMPYATQNSPILPNGQELQMTMVNQYPMSNESSVIVTPQQMQNAQIISSNFQTQQYAEPHYSTASNKVNYNIPVSNGSSIVKNIGLFKPSSPYLESNNANNATRTSPAVRNPSYNMQPQYNTYQALPQTQNTIPAMPAQYRQAQPQMMQAPVIQAPQAFTQPIQQVQQNYNQANQQIQQTQATVQGYRDSTTRRFIRQDIAEQAVNSSLNNHQNMINTQPLIVR